MSEADLASFRSMTSDLWPVNPSIHCLAGYRSCRAGRSVISLQRWPFLLFPSGSVRPRRPLWWCPCSCRMAAVCCKPKTATRCGCHGCGRYGKHEENAPQPRWPPAFLICSLMETVRLKRRTFSNKACVLRERLCVLLCGPERLSEIT